MFVAVASADLGEHVSGFDFDLHVDNTAPETIGWDGTNFYVGQGSGNNARVHVYSSSGEYLRQHTINLGSGFDYLATITWTGSHFYVGRGAGNPNVWAFDADWNAVPARNFGLGGGSVGPVVTIRSA